MDTYFPNDEDKLLRDLLNKSSADFSKIENVSPYPLVWDKFGNFIGHLVFDTNYKKENVNE